MHKLNYFFIYLSFMVGMMLLILPLPDWARIYRPDWVALILIYWSMALPKYVGLFTAFITGSCVHNLHKLKCLFADTSFIISSAESLCFQFTGHIPVYYFLDGWNHGIKDAYSSGFQWSSYWHASVAVCILYTA